MAASKDDIAFAIVQKFLFELSGEERKALTILFLQMDARMRHRGKNGHGVSRRSAASASLLQ